MDFRMSCRCGRPFVVTEGAADATVECHDCGRVPSLKELRIEAGLPPCNASPELVIERLLESGITPGGDTCVHCGLPTDETVQIMMSGPTFSHIDARHDRIT
jgi:hypothetical protein